METWPLLLHSRRFHMPNGHLLSLYSVRPHTVPTRREIREERSDGFAEFQESQRALHADERRVWILVAVSDGSKDAVTTPV